MPIQLDINNDIKETRKILSSTKGKQERSFQAQINSNSSKLYNLVSYDNNVEQIDKPIHQLVTHIRITHQIYQIQIKHQIIILKMKLN